MPEVHLDTPYKPPIPPFDKVHLESMTISLSVDQASVASIYGRLRPYGKTAEGVKVFSDDVIDFNIGNAQEFAATLAMNGDMRGVEADEHLSQLVALIASAATTLGETSVS
jgi:hypothetical protein